MKIAVLSDTHGLLRPEAARRIGECDAVIHAGDFCTKEIWEQVSACRKPGAEFYAVRGNNDREFMDFLPESQSFDLGGFRFFLVHDIEDLPRELSECQIVIFGHSHKYAKIERDGRLWLNPGSCGKRRFSLPVTMAVLHLEAGAWSVERIELFPGEKELTELSRFLSLILRHKPEAAGIALDGHGWAKMDELLEGIRKTRPISMEILEEIVRTDKKMRYSFNEDKTKIRANQGHSIEVDVELKREEPPEFLYHGTGEKFVSSIEKKGLLPKSRLYVHLSGDPEMAKIVGSRHGKPVVFLVESGRMAKDGYVFFRSVNGVWLTGKVPEKYLKRL